MKAIRISIGGLLVVLLAIQIAVAARTDQETARMEAHDDLSVTKVQGAWQDYPMTLAEARQKSVAIIVARVLEVQQAPDIVIRDEILPDGEHRHPNQRIIFDVLKQIRGNVGQELKLWHFGDAKLVLSDDPHYQVGETYVLFVKPVDTEPGTYATLGPPTRYKVVDGALELMPEVNDLVPFARALRGKPVAALEQAIARDEIANK